MKKTAEEIQDEYAEKLGYDNFYCLIKDDVRSIDSHTMKVQELYKDQYTTPLIEALEVIIKTFDFGLLSGQLLSADERSVIRQAKTALLNAKGL